MTKIDGRSKSEAAKQLDEGLRRFQTDCIDLVLEIGVLGMKCLAKGIILKSKTVTAIECIPSALNLPTSVVITGIDSLEILDQATEAARTFRQLSEVGVHQMLAKTATAAVSGKFESFKTTSIFNASALNPKWLGEESEESQKMVNA